MLALRHTLFPLVALGMAATILAIPSPHRFNRMRCHAYNCNVYHCVDNPNAPSQDILQVASNQNLYSSLGNDCASITSIPLVKPVMTDADESPQVYCPSGKGLWLATYTLEIWRSPDHYAQGDHVTNWNNTRWPGASMWRAHCEVDNGDVTCLRGDPLCKNLYATRPGEVAAAAA